MFSGKNFLLVLRVSMGEKKLQKKIVVSLFLFLSLCLVVFKGHMLLREYLSDSASLVICVSAWGIVFSLMMAIFFREPKTDDVGRRGKKL